jgi:hypothetical protein
VPLAFRRIYASRRMFTINNKHSALAPSALLLPSRKKTSHKDDFQKRLYIKSSPSKTGKPGTAATAINAGRGGRVEGLLLAVPSSGTAGKDSRTGRRTMVFLSEIPASSARGSTCGSSKLLVATTSARGGRLDDSSLVRSTSLLTSERMSSAASDGGAAAAGDGTKGVAFLVVLGGNGNVVVLGRTVVLLLLCIVVCLVVGVVDDVVFTGVDDGLVGAFVDVVTMKA